MKKTTKKTTLTFHLRYFFLIIIILTLTLRLLAWEIYRDKNSGTINDTSYPIESNEYYNSLSHFRKAYLMAIIYEDTISQKTILKDMASITVTSLKNNKIANRLIIPFINSFMEKDINNQEYKALFQYHLYELLKENAAYQLASVYQDSLIKTKQQIFHQSYQNMIHESNTYTELIQNEKALIENELRIKIIYAIIIVMGLVVLVAIKRYASQNKKNRHKKQITMLELKKERAEKILLENKMKEQEVFSLFEQERLKKELEKLEREVNSKNNELISRALFMANRNKFIVELMQTISETNDYSENPDLKKISQKLNEQINANNERESFFAYFQQYNVSFIEALKKRHNNLTINEVRFLCLIYMDLNMKEIASLLNLSAEYCKKRKQQIAHKIGLEHTSLLYNYLFDLSMHSKSKICN